MKISDELIACYVDGKVTAEERKCVREYLCSHPHEMERVLCLMDNYTDDYLDEQQEVSSNYSISMNASISDADEFSTMSFSKNKKSKSANISGLFDRLSKLSNEIDNLI